MLPDQARTDTRNARDWLYQPADREAQVAEEAQQRAEEQAAHGVGDHPYPSNMY